MDLSDDAWLDQRATARALAEKGIKVSPVTLSTKRSRGGGPQYRYFGRRVLYRWGDVLAWVRSRLSEPVTSASAPALAASTAALNAAETAVRATRAMRALEAPSAGRRDADVRPRIERLSEPVTSTSETTAA
jgi:hypothetical protein